MLPAAQINQQKMREYFILHECYLQSERRLLELLLFGREIRLSLVELEAFAVEPAAGLHLGGGRGRCVLALFSNILIGQK